MSRLTAILAARLAPWTLAHLDPAWVLERLDASWALRLLAEGARRLPASDDGALADAMLSEVLADLAPFAQRAGWRLERMEP